MFSNTSKVPQKAQDGLKPFPVFQRAQDPCEIHSEGSGVCGNSVFAALLNHGQSGESPEEAPG